MNHHPLDFGSLSLLWHADLWASEFFPLGGERPVLRSPGKDASRLGGGGLPCTDSPQGWLEGQPLARLVFGSPKPDMGRRHDWQ